MLNLRIQSVEGQSETPKDKQKSFPMGLTVASMVGVLVWLIFILLFALYWSEGFSLFQDIVVFIVSAGVMGLVIGIMWIIWGKDRMQTWSQ